MIPAPMPKNEAERIATLQRYAILDTEPERAFDRITSIAVKLFNVPIALVSLVDADRQWFKSSCGLGKTQTPRDLAFCSYTILSDDVLCVPDATRDKRFAKNPLVTGELGIRFYCGAPLVSPNGQRLGSLCVIDQKPRHNFSEEQQALLTDLASLVVEQMEMRVATGNVLTEIESRQEAEKRAAATELQMFALIENAPVPIALFGRDRSLLSGSEVWRTTMKEGALSEKETTKRLRNAFDRALEGLSTRVHEDRIPDQENRNRCFQWETRPWFNENKTVEGVIVCLSDITEQVEARHSLERQSELLNAVLENVNDGIVACDSRGTLTTFNRKAREMHGTDLRELPTDQCAEAYNLYEADGKTLMSPDRVPLFAALKDGGVSDEEMVIAPRGLPKRQIVAQAVPLHSEDGRLLGAVASLSDVTEARAAERKLRESEVQAKHVAFHDSLTGLPNRARFSQFVHETDFATHAARTAVLYIDLAHFKAINDTFGHKCGDDVLVSLAKILTDRGGEEAFVARIGGDEFVLIAPVENENCALELAQEIISDVSKPKVIDGKTIATRASIGIAFGPDHGDQYDELTRRADLAMYKAKRSGSYFPVIFEPVLELEAIKRRAMESDLDRSIDRNEMEVYFQPIVDARTRHTRGVEALVRWHHPEKGLVSPADFVPVAEESGFILNLGEWVLRTAMEKMSAFPNLFLSVNLSPVQFRDGLLVDRIKAAIEETNFDPRRLELEITEGLLINDADVARRALGAFGKLGIRIALDDFGTGYSSLSYVQSFPFDKVKIDKSFVADIETNSQSAAVVQCVVSLASTLGMVVTAEGIESDSHEMLLNFIGCDTLQGYRYSKPLPFDHLVEFLSQRGEGAVDSKSAAA
jgi:diguanylate cyclase (GGDEF)-like protein